MYRETQNIIIVALIILFFLSIGMTGYILATGGQLEFKLDYKNSYDSCQNSLSICKESKIPQCSDCPEVKCKETIGSWFLWIAGFILYITGLFYFISNREKKKSTKKKGSTK